MRVVNNQLSGAQRAQIELIDYLYRLSNCLYGFSSSLIGKRVKSEGRLN